jgi:Ca2+-binding RTX toxin-like protein
MLAVLILLGLAGALVASVWAGSASPTKVIEGTKKADTLVGTPRADRIVGHGGDDWLRGVGGGDVLVGGPGKDVLSGGPGNDLIQARDGQRDRVFCGRGDDTVVADDADSAYGDCENVQRPSIPLESRTDCATTNYETWSWEQCKPGTKIVVTNQAWDCRKPLSSYGKLPIKVVSISTTAWDAIAPVTVNSGCTGSPGTDVNLIVDIRGGGPTSPYGSGADGFKTRVDPQNLRITGSIQCGRRAPDSHQDSLQIQGGTNITFVNVIGGGSYDAGLSTCQGAGGGPFYSLNRIVNVDVLGGKWISCNHALDGGHPGTDNDIVDAKFRSGRVDGSDPNCNGFFSSPPCVRTAALRLKDITCERWVGGRWTPFPPR